MIDRYTGRIIIVFGSESRPNNVRFGADLPLTDANYFKSSFSTIAFNYTSSNLITCVTLVVSNYRYINTFENFSAHKL